MHETRHGLKIEDFVGSVPAAGLVSNAYDAATGWLDASRGADGRWVRYIRSDGGAVTACVSVAGTALYAYDKAGRRVRSVSPAGTLAFGHCPWNGLLAAVTNANGIVTAYAYDVMDRVTNVTWSARGGASLGGFSYAYDAIGRIVVREHALGTNRFDRAYAYDGLDRLVSDGGVSYAYDAAGNRTAKRGDAGGDVAYALGAGDRLASWTGGSYDHDAAGCVTRIARGADTWDLTWNGQYQLVSVATNGAFAESYAYDALGRRAATTSAAGTERHVYDESWQVIADVDESGRVIRAYEWGEGIDRLLAVRIGSRTYTALTDIQGTIWGYADERGAVVARWTYDAWGNVLSEDVAASAAELRAVRYRFQGRERSAATGLVNFRMRWYDPVTGRWLSKDPIGLSGGLNLYAFCANNSLSYVDPSGRIIMISPHPDPSNWGCPPPDWHTRDRKRRNSPLPQTPPSDECESEWKKLPPWQSQYHDNGTGQPEEKYVHPDGREVVYDGDTKRPIIDPALQGSYNYVNPATKGDSALSWTWRSIGHFCADVLPYLIWGN